MEFTGRERIDILAYVTRIKLSRNNSIIYAGESLNRLAGNLGVNRNTLKKYLELFERMGWMQQVGPHRAICNLGRIIKDLGFTQKWFKHVAFYNKATYKKVSFSAIRKEIQDSIMIVNFMQQQWRVKKNQDRLDAARFILRKKKKKVVLDGNQMAEVPFADIKNVYREASKSGTTSVELAKSIRKQDKTSSRLNIVAGKHMTGRTLGMSSSTGTRVLRRLAKGKVRRKVQKVMTDVPLSSINLEALQNSYDYVVPNYKTNTFEVFLGSRIRLNTRFMKTYGVKNEAYGKGRRWKSPKGSNTGIQSSHQEGFNFDNLF